MAEAVDLNVPQFVQQVRRRAVIWNKRLGASNEKVASAWHQVCKQTWPEFDTWAADQKRTRCLSLQKKWKNLQDQFVREYHKHKKGGTASKSLHFDLMMFLVVEIEKPGQDGSSLVLEGDCERVAKRRRTSVLSSEEASSPGPSSSQEEDRHFLLSLVSYMQEVPRASKLALREDMLRLLRKYTDASMKSA